MEDIYERWFLNAGPGKIIYRVANATGNNPTANLSYGEMENYLHKRSIGRYSDTADRQENEAQRTDKMLRILTDPARWNNEVPAFGFKIAYCIFCDHRFFKVRGVPHICPEFGGTPLNAQSDGLNYSLVFYAHDALELLENGGRDLPEMEEFDAATVINNATDRIVQYDIGSLGEVYCVGTTDTTPDFVMTMAVDREIIFNMEGRIDLAEHDDEFIIQTHQTRNALIRFFFDSKFMAISFMRNKMWRKRFK